MFGFDLFYRYFSDKTSCIDIKEDFDDATYKFSSSELKYHDIESINNFVNSIKKYCNSIALFYSLDDIGINSYNLLDYSSIQELIEAIIDYQKEEGTHTIELRVQKKNSLGYNPIFNLKSFIDYFDILSIPTLLATINAKLPLKLFLLNDHEYLETKSIIVSSNTNDFVIDFNTNERDWFYKKHEDIISQTGSEIRNLLPQDFFIINRSNNHRLNNLFDFLCLLLCFSYIANFTEISIDYFTYKFIGFKQLKGVINKTATVNFDTLKIYYKIFDWIYKENTVSDRCSLARNLITMNLSENNITNFTRDLYSELLSCNEIYVRENVDKYIEVKNNVVNLLNELNTKIIDTTDSFSSKIRNNLLALVSFCFSTILLNTIATGNLSNIFTKDITFISYTFIIGSFFYLILTLIDYRKSIKRYVKFYNRQKEFYKDILNNADIDNIFLNDKPFKDDLKGIRWLALRYSLLWIFVILLAIRLIDILSGYSLFQIAKLFF